MSVNLKDALLHYMHYITNDSNPITSWIYEVLEFHVHKKCNSINMCQMYSTNKQVDYKKWIICLKTW